MFPWVGTSENQKMMLPIKVTYVILNTHWLWRSIDMRRHVKLHNYTLSPLERVKREYSQKSSRTKSELEEVNYTISSTQTNYSWTQPGKHFNND